VAAVTAAPRAIRVRLQPNWAPPAGKGLLDGDPRVRTLCKVLVTYPGVRHILPDRISFDASVDLRLLETVAGFLERQHWLVGGAEVE
jgi:hypothetical protein